MSSLSIIIPCYNEANNIKNLINRFVLFDKFDSELILVNNGSTDNTNQLFSELAIDYENIKFVKIKNNVGYGHGIIKGIEEAKNDIIAWTHADLQTDISDIFKAYNKFLSQKKIRECIVKGRRVGRRGVDNFFTLLMSITSKLVLGVELRDINAQPKIFNKSFFLKLKNPPLDFSIDLFLMYKAKKNNMDIIEIPVNFGKRLHGKSKGGGTWIGKIKLIKRTLIYIFNLKKYE